MKRYLAFFWIGLVIVLVAFIYTPVIRDMPGMESRGQGGMGNFSQAPQNTVSMEATPLPIPPILEDQNPDPQKAEFHLSAKQSSKEFIPGKETETLGYNGDYLGPVIRVQRGEDVLIKVTNRMDEDTTIHWHGLEVSGEMDGGPHSVIEPGETGKPAFTINQPAATLWYHPHLLHKTGEQVYKGLSGLLIIDDNVSAGLDIPKDYGLNDFPLIIQDKRFDSEGKATYDLGMRDLMMGFQGETLIVNGAINPFVEVPRGMVRFRLLNGSNAQIYELTFNDQRAFHQIASDGGFLESPVQMEKLVLGPAERAEILVNFSDLKTGDEIQLLNQGSAFMNLVIGKESDKKFTLPNQLAKIEWMDEEEASIKREFVFQGMGPSVNINGKQMDMSRIDEELELNGTEIWEIANESGMGMMGGTVHPFHAHGTQFQILDRNGNPPAPNEQGWKDTFLVYPGERLRVIASFDQKGVFMYHCHILEHEDAGMMGQFRVQ